MKIELFCLCDYASNDDGHLTIVKTLDEIIIDKEPWRAYFGFALKGIIIHPLDPDSVLKLSIRKIIDHPNQEEAEKLTVATKPLFETETLLGEKVGKFVAAGNMRGIIFDTSGYYRFRIETEKKIIEDYYFKVTLPQPETNE